METELVLDQAHGTNTRFALHFLEGFDTADLKDAKALLEDLST